MQSEQFGRYVKATINAISSIEGKTNPIVEEELGDILSLSTASIQRYKAGHIPPEPATIEVLAEAAVKRGGFGRKWLEGFLRAARYPKPDKLLDQLTPVESSRERPERIYQNLPPPPYSNFVMRQEAFDQILEGLYQRSPLVLVSSLGGMGKTSLALEIAYYCMGKDSEHNFDAAVWISDKDRDGATTLNVVLDEIARVLDYPGHTQLPPAEKQYEVEQLLRRLKVLVIVDNFETITDEALVVWLLRLPVPSKALITTRVYHRKFRRNTWPIDLHGMNNAEAVELIRQGLKTRKMEKLVTDETQVTPLITITGGNPQAIEMALGCIKHQHHPIERVLNDLAQAKGELFDDLFTRAWSLLNEAERRVLLAATFFIGSASSEALAATADVQGDLFETSLETLTDFALLDVLNLSRYQLHPLVMAFARTKLKENADYEAGMRSRWLAWFAEITSKVGYTYYNSERLELLDIDSENVFAAAVWAIQHNHFEDALKIAKGSDHYFYVRGPWDQSLAITSMYTEAARKLNDKVEEAEARAGLIGTLSLLLKFKEAEAHIPRLNELVASVELPYDIFWDTQYNLACYLFCVGDIAGAKALWESLSLDTTKLSPRAQSEVSTWIAGYLYYENKVAETQAILEEGLALAESCNYQRNVLFITIILTVIALDLGQLDVVEKNLKLLEVRSNQYQEGLYIGMTRYLYAHLYTLNSNIPAAIEALTKAAEDFERIGIREGMKAARERLAVLKTLEDTPDDSRLATVFGKAEHWQFLWY